MVHRLQPNCFRPQLSQQKLHAHSSIESISTVTELHNHCQLTVPTSYHGYIGFHKTRAHVCACVWPKHSKTTLTDFDCQWEDVIQSSIGVHQILCQLHYILHSREWQTPKWIGCSCPLRCIKGQILCLTCSSIAKLIHCRECKRLIRACLSSQKTGVLRQDFHVLSRLFLHCT